MVVRTGLEGPDLLALEYEQLKQEQRQRIGTRDNLLYATLGAYAVVVAAALQVGDVLVILLLPPVCLILGWTYYVNDHRITAIGRYIESTIVPSLSTLPGSGSTIFAWERAHRVEPGRRLLKVWQTLVDLTAFVAPILLAVAAVVQNTAFSPSLAVAVAAEAISGCVLGLVILVHAVRAARVP